MKSEKLLDAIGNIDDQLIEEASPFSTVSKTVPSSTLRAKIVKLSKVNWRNYAPLAACFFVFIIGLWAMTLVIGPKGKSNSAESAVHEEAAVEEAVVMEEEADLEDEVVAEEEADLGEEAVTEDSVTDEVPDTAEAPADTEKSPQKSDNQEPLIRHGVSYNGWWYSPTHVVSEAKLAQYGLLIDIHAGSSYNNIYAATQSDLGEFMGTVENSTDGSMIGLNIYHYAKFPDTDRIFIVDCTETYGIYQLYIANDTPN